MATLQRSPWDIYQEQLFQVGYGLPLWHPEPNEPDGIREVPVPVSMGSVGFMRDGQFIVIFDSTKPHTDRTNRRGVPIEFEPFNPDGAGFVNRCDKIQQKIVPSRNLRDVTVEAGASTSSSVSAGVGGGVKYEVSSDLGALVMLRPPGRLQNIVSRPPVKEYILHNIEYWLELANGGMWNLGLKEHDLMFVSGTVTTPEWLVMAMSGKTSRKKELSVSGDIGMLASGNFTISVSDQALLATHHRAGPTVAGRPLSIMNSAHDGSSTGESNQTIFIHYWKLRWKIFGARWLEARAGPHELPDGGDDPDVYPGVMAGEYGWDAEEASIPLGAAPFDPVNYLLEFILQHPRANAAIASDTDLMLLFPDGHIPDDIPAALQELAFDSVVSVDDNGVGMILDSSERAPKRSYYDAEAAEYPAEAPAHKRPRLASHGSGSDSDEDDDDEYDGQPVDYHDGYPNDPQTHAGYPATGQQRSEDDDGPQGSLRKHAEMTGSHQGSITALTYSADGALVATGCDDATVVVWNARSLAPIHFLRGQANPAGEPGSAAPAAPADPTSAIAFSRDNRLVVIATQGGDIILYSTQNGAEFHRLRPASPAQSLAFSPDGTLLLAGIGSGELARWNTANWSSLPGVRRNSASMTFISFSRDEQKMVTGGMEKDCVIWETATLGDDEPRSLVIGDGHIVYATAFAPDGLRIVTSFDDGNYTVWNTETGEALVHVREHTGPVWAVAFSPDGTLIASGGDDCEVKVVDSYTGARVLAMNDHRGMVNQVGFSTDGRFVASASSDKTVILWNATSGEKEVVYNEHDDDVTQMVFSPDGKTLASGSLDGGVHIRPIPQASSIG